MSLNCKESWLEHIVDMSKWPERLGKELGALTYDDILYLDFSRLLSEEVQNTEENATTRMVRGIRFAQQIVERIHIDHRDSSDGSYFLRKSIWEFDSAMEMAPLATEPPLFAWLAYEFFLRSTIVGPSAWIVNSEKLGEDGQSFPTMRNMPYLNKLNSEILEAAVPLIERASELESSFHPNVLMGRALLESIYANPYYYQNQVMEDEMTIKDMWTDIGRRTYQALHFLREAERINPDIEQLQLDLGEAIINYNCHLPKEQRANASEEADLHYEEAYWLKEDLFRKTNDPRHMITNSDYKMIHVLHRKKDYRGMIAQMEQIINRYENAHSKEDTTSYDIAMIYYALGRAKFIHGVGGKFNALADFYRMSRKANEISRSAFPFSKFARHVAMAVISQDMQKNFVY